jgi:hypothetical protein
MTSIRVTSVFCLGFCAFSSPRGAHRVASVVVARVDACVEGEAEELAMHWTVARRGDPLLEYGRSLE